MTLKKAAKMIPAVIARAQFVKILKRVRRNKERFIVGENGKAQAVIVSVDEYLRSVVPTPEPMRKIQKAAKGKGLDQLSMREINAAIKRTRRERHAEK